MPTRHVVEVVIVPVIIPFILILILILIVILVLILVLTLLLLSIVYSHGRLTGILRKYAATCCRLPLGSIDGVLILVFALLVFTLTFTSSYWFYRPSRTSDPPAPAPRT